MSFNPFFKWINFNLFPKGFSELSQDDQLMLIKGGFFELWLTRVSRLISSGDGTLTFSDGSYLTRHQLELIFEVQNSSGFSSNCVFFFIFTILESFSLKSFCYQIRVNFKWFYQKYIFFSRFASILSGFTPNINFFIKFDPFYPKYKCSSYFFFFFWDAKTA